MSSDKMEKKKGCASGLVTGSMLRALVYLLKGLFKLIAALMVYFGLWIPSIYALFGCVLYLVFKFNPFDKSINAQLYLAGFALTVFCALIITVKNIVIKPTKSIIEGYKYPMWKRDKAQPKEQEAPPEYDKEYKKDKRKKKIKEPENRYIRYPKEEYKEPKPEYKEQPRIYYSVREKDTLIHEYSDRFEVYRIVEGRPLLHKVEYKNYDL